MSAQGLTKVLVVDDDPVVGKSFDRVLSAKGYAVVTACNGEEALRRIAAEDYDAVFTDIKMPGIDGIAVAEQIRARQPWLPVVIVSGYATAEAEARARAAGVCAVLHKPLSPQMIEQGALDALREAGAAPAAPATAAAPVTAAEPAEAPVAVAPDAPQPWRRVPALAAPFVTLAFITLAPLLGLVALVAIPLWHFGRWLVARPSSQFRQWSRDVALFVAAPFLCLAYIVAGPFVGLGAIVWFGFKALSGHPAKTELPEVK